jgi:hypothetical protein
VYSLVLTAVFAFTVWTQLSAHKKARFDEIEVHRINVVEPDGTLRIVLSSQGRGDDGAAVMALMDGKGRKRIRMQVLENGKPSLAFLDENGNVVQEFSTTP